MIRGGGHDIIDGVNKVVQWPVVAALALAIGPVKAVCPHDLAVPHIVARMAVAIDRNAVLQQKPVRAAHTLSFAVTEMHINAIPTALEKP